MNQGGKYRATGVEIGSATEDSAGGYYVGWIGTGEWYEYSLNVAHPGTYTLEARVASPFSGKGFHLEWNGRDISGLITVPYTSSWHIWRTTVINVNFPD